MYTLGMSTTTIKVPTQLRDRLARRARLQHTTLSGAVAAALDVVEEAEFWAEVRATMGATDLAQDAEQFSGAASDGLEPEDWSDILDVTDAGADSGS